MPASLIFPGSRPPSIVSADELNYCVRYGNRWDLIAIDTGCVSALAAWRPYQPVRTLEVSFRWILALPIFPGSRPPSIFGADELNFCVRYGNRWILIAINTRCLVTRTGIEPMLTA